MKILRAKESRTITVDEVREWVGNSSKSTLDKAQYSKIAAGLTKFRWPADPPDPPGSPWLPKESEADLNRWWDFKGTTDAAKLLFDSLPLMLSHWERLLWAPETPRWL